MKLELPRMGHRVTVCPDGLTAVAALEKNTYDCIIVDLDMPGLDGIGVIAKCKETLARHRSGRAHRQELARHGDRGAAPWRVRLSHEALQADRDRSAAEARHRKRNCSSRSIVRWSTRFDRLEGAPRLIGNTPSMQKVRMLIEQGRPDRIDRADSRRNRHRQGTRRPVAARSQHSRATCRSSRSTAARCPKR